MKPLNEIISRLNVSQRQAVDTIEGPVMVIAGPGTGKTEVLTLRIAAILEQTQMNPENILALTFTEAAVHEMRQRLLKLIGNAAYRLSLYTFHGFCNDIIQQFSDDFDELIDARPISELEQIQLVEHILETGTFKMIKPLATPLFYARTLVGALNQLKRERITHEQLLAGIAEDEQAFTNTEGKVHEKGRYKGKMKGEFQRWEKRIAKNKEVAIIYDRYQTELLKRKHYDFNDMILKVIAVLENNPTLLQQLQERYQYFLVDEHQDTNTSQNTLIELLGSFYENPNIFIVGDEKQAIFRFQGASLENFLYFKERYPAAILIHLDNNYRSSQAILDASHSVIAHSSVPLPSLTTKLAAKSARKNVPIQIAALETHFAEPAYVAKDIKLKVANGIPANAIAAICRTNRDLFELATVLERNQIPFSIENDQNILEDLNIQKLFTLLTSIVKLPDDPSLVQTMHLDFLNIPPLDVYRVITAAKGKRMPIWEYLEKELPPEDMPPLTHFFELIQQWRTYAENNRLDDTLVQIVQKSGFMEYCLQLPSSFDLLDKLTRLFQEVRIHVYDEPTYSLQEFLDYITLLKTHNLQLHARHITGTREAVQLVTAHKAKGREFDYVYILNCFDGHWGSSRTKPQLIALPWEYLGISRTPQELNTLVDDERRLFYVALTRARHGITITYATHNLEGKEQMPSQFISEIDPAFKAEADVKEFAATFENEKQELFSLVAAKKPTDIFFANKPYFHEKLKRLGLSVTSLNNYLTCPWRFFFRNLIQIPEEKNASQLYGTAIHQALNIYITKRLKGTESLDTLIKAFTDSLGRQPFLAEEVNEWQERGITSLTGFYHERIPTWKSTIQSELAIPGILYNENLFLSGKIDMIEVESAQNEVTVYDFKTGKPKSRNVIEGLTGTSNGDYKRQLVFYKLLLDGYRDGFYTMTGGVIEFVEPSDSGTYAHELFEITPEDTKKLTEEIDTFYQDMQELNFWNRFCDDPKCEYCHLRRYMSDPTGIVSTE